MPEEPDAVVLRLPAKHPDERFPTASRLRTALEDVRIRAHRPRTTSARRRHGGPIPRRPSARLAVLPVWGPLAVSAAALFAPAYRRSYGASVVTLRVALAVTASIEVAREVRCRRPPAISPKFSGRPTQPA
ncbi:hypothetical protein [Embleya hyalina]|uniref:hypothetical protein n=1 Tax=Embleya hyalina TaxID=516124 RepID=UPI000F84561F|nr:hypothetical protein [Embleya hyalina]